MELSRMQLVLCPVHLEKGTALAPHNRIFLYLSERMGGNTGKRVVSVDGSFDLLVVS